MHLTGIDLLDWIGLRRVTEGGVALYESGYVQWGQKVPCYLPEVFGRFVETELTDLLDVNNEGLRRMVMTPRGRDRYQGLRAKRGLPIDPEQSSGDCSVHPRPSAVPDCGRVGGLNDETIRW
ncbi:MAG: hypothetical protein ACT4NY_21075 [Pseudonocardiales bacterium]